MKVTYIKICTKNIQMWYLQERNAWYMHGGLDEN